MHNITEEVIDYVGILAKLSLSEEEKKVAAKDMEKMLDYVDALKAVDTDGVEPMTHVYEDGNVLREDEVTGEDGRQAILGGAPKVKDGSLEVPKTIAG